MPGYPGTTPCGEPTCPSPPSGSGSGGWRLWRDSGTKASTFIRAGRHLAGSAHWCASPGEGPARSSTVPARWWVSRSGGPGKAPCSRRACIYVGIPRRCLRDLPRPTGPRGTDVRSENGGGGSRRAGPSGRGPRFPARAAARLVRRLRSGRGVADLSVFSTFPPRFPSFVSSFLPPLAHPFDPSPLERRWLAGLSGPSARERSRAMGLRRTGSWPGRSGRRNGPGSQAAAAIHRWQPSAGDAGPGGGCIWVAGGP